MEHLGQRRSTSTFARYGFYRCIITYNSVFFLKNVLKYACVYNIRFMKRLPPTKSTLGCWNAFRRSCMKRFSRKRMDSSPKRLELKRVSSSFLMAWILHILNTVSWRSFCPSMQMSNQVLSCFFKLSELENLLAAFFFFLFSKNWRSSKWG